MILARALIGFLAVAAASAQSILPPFDTTYQILNLGPIPSVGNYGGTAFLPSNPNVLLVAPYLGGGVPRPAARTAACASARPACCSRRGTGPTL